METAIRWSTHSTLDEQRFLLVDVAGSTLRLCKVTSEEGSELKYETICTQSKVPAFRAFDWSPTDEALVAVGQPNGETTVLRINGDTQDALSLPVKMPRLCNAVTFSTEGLLAAGLDKVRNDFCLNIWDITQRAAAGKSASFESERRASEPLRKYAINETITSIKFFSDQPETLVTGVKGQFIRIYDLRDSPGNPAIQFPTRCVQNLAIDLKDENYFASAVSGRDSMVCVWDRRSSPRFSAAMLGSGHHSAEQAALELKNPISNNGTDPSNIWSVRFSKTKRGCLGILSSSGQVKVYELTKEYIHQMDLESNNRADINQAPEQLYATISHDVQYPYYSRYHGYDASKRVVSFDFVTLGDSFHRHLIVGLRGKDDVRIFELSQRPPTFDLSSRANLGYGEASQGRSQSKSANGTSLHRAEDTQGAEHWNFKEMCPISQGKIAETLRTLRAKIEAAQIASDMTKLGHNETDDTSRRVKRVSRTMQVASQGAHQKLLSIGPPGYKLRVEEALTLVAIERQRCEEGYLFDTERNTQVLADDRRLRELWLWIGRARAYANDYGMICNGVDFSYLGVHGLWHHDLGFHPETRITQGNPEAHPDFIEAVKKLVREIELPDFQAQGPDTQFPELRQLCLFCCGSPTSSTELETLAKSLVRRGQPTKAAALAVFHGNAGFACSALLSSPTSSAHKLLAMGIRGFAKGDYNEDWNETCKTIARDLDDPYARAIMAFVGSEDWWSILDDISLPVSDRVGVALMHLPDSALTQYLNATTTAAIRDGDLEGIVLTGLTEQAIDLFQNYINKSNDVQTPALAMSFTSPRYITDSRHSHWKEIYRHAIQSWNMHHARIRFDIQATKLSRTSAGRITLTPPPRQISLRCTYCERPLARNENEEDDATTNEGVHPTEHHPLAGRGPTSGTVCLKCGRRLPRCGVCMKWLGVPDPTSRGAVAAATTAAAAEGRGTDQTQDLMAGFLTFCMSCSHGFHARHAREWFGLHRVCPVSECRCLCGVGA